MKFLPDRHEVWTCPYCRGEIVLTWKLYFLDSSRPVCPHCQRRSRLDGRKSPTLWSLRFATNILGGAPFAIAAQPWGNRAMLLGYILGSAVLGIPADKYMDQHLRNLEPGDEE